MNHELGATFPGSSDPGVNARISKLVVDKETRSVLVRQVRLHRARGLRALLLGDALGDQRDAVLLHRRGAATIQPGRPDDGSSIAMNAETGQWWETAHFGHLQHENIVPGEALEVVLPDHRRRLPGGIGRLPLRLHRGVVPGRDLR